LSQSRTARIQRNTRETRITISLVLPDDAPPRAAIDTPLPFLSHMLEALAKHGAMQLEVQAEGDVEVDGHHTVEDIGLVLGSAIDEALGSREGIHRFGHFSLAMDEALVDCAIDLGGRPFLSYDLPAIAGRRVGDFDADLVKEFFSALAIRGRMNVHLRQRSGGNTHHVVEAAFKVFARSLRMACARDPAAHGVPSTKGTI
jgi:imidazoleglycerol-phosphate dehydratase